MLNKDYTTEELLNLEDVVVANVENRADEVHIFWSFPERSTTVQPVGRSRTVCTTTGCRPSRMFRWQKNLPASACRYRYECGKRFFEKNAFVDRYQRITDRIAATVIASFEKLAPAKEIGSQFNISGTTLMRYFKCVDFKAAELPEVLSLDEFKGNSGGNKYNSIVADPQNHKIVDILPNRYENDLI